MLLIDACTPSEKAKTQGMNDVIVFTVMSISSFSSGALISAAGLDWMNLGALPLLGRRRQRSALADGIAAAERARCRQCESDQSDVRRRMYHTADGSDPPLTSIRSCARACAHCAPRFDSAYCSASTRIALPRGVRRRVDRGRLARGDDSRRVRRSGLGLTEASVIMEEINRSAAMPGPAMARCTTWARFCATARKRRSGPGCRRSRGEAALQSMAVTEPSTGSDTTRLTTTAVRQGDRYIISGQKVWTSRLQHSDLMIVLARTTPLTEVKRRSEGMSVLMVDLGDALSPGAHGGMTCVRSPTWSTTRPTKCSSTISRFRRKT